MSVRARRVTIERARNCSPTDEGFSRPATSGSRIYGIFFAVPNAFTQMHYSFPVILRISNSIQSPGASWRSAIRSGRIIFLAFSPSRSRPEIAALQDRWKDTVRRVCIYGKRSRILGHSAQLSEFLGANERCETSEPLTEPCQSHMCVHMYIRLSSATWIFAIKFPSFRRTYRYVYVYIYYIINVN